MRVSHRRIAAAAAAACWFAVFVTFGLEPDRLHLYLLLLVAASTLTVIAGMGFVITPLLAARGLGVRAAMRAVRGEPAGKHAARDDNVVDIGARRS